ncbi:MAG TPA: ABC transporter permease [Gemmatimonadales bacterium]|nr:ABC transporter permease [Gemmatimonadales bacterium]
MLQDLRYALRSLRKSPGFTTAAVLTLALGIGANTAIFSVVDGVLLRSSPFEDIGRLMVIWETDRKSGTTREPASVPDYLDFRERTARFGELAAMAASEVNLTPDDGDPARLAGLLVTHEYFGLLGLVPVLGRAFMDEEDQPGGPAVVLIGEDLWERLFSRDPAVVGRTLRLNDIPRTIVGVLPRGADFGMLQILKAAAYSRGFADRGGRTQVDVWLPLQPNPAVNPRGNHPIFVLGRLAPGASAETAQEEMATITADLEATYADNGARGANVEHLEGVVFGPVKPALIVLLGAVAFVLLVACANVANLLLVRGAARAREVTVRTALGAGVRRLARQFVAEGAVLTTAGAVLGVGLAILGLDVLLSLAPADIPRVAEVGIDARVLGATIALSVVVGLAFGLLPTLQARRLNLQASLQGESRGASAGREHRRLRSTLVVTELALAVMLMIGAGLLVKSFWRLQQVDPGFQASGVLKAEYQLPASRYPRDFSQWPNWPAPRRFNDDLRNRVRALPGVQGVTMAGSHPLDAGYTSSIRVVGREAEAADWPEPSIRIVAPGYFETLGVPLVEGRRFGESDVVTATPVIVINQAARRRYFETQEPLGQQINLWGANRTVVGVVENERIHGVATEPPPAVYLPLGQVPSASGSHSLLVRATGDPVALAPVVRRVVRELDPALPLFGVEPLERTLANSVGQRRFTMLVLGLFAAVALLLAAVGVHGVLSYTVAQRTREIGIRMALGADLREVRRLVLGQGARLAAIGLGLGLLGALALSRLLSALLYGTGADDPATYASVALALGAVALLATYLPARRATRVHPVEALRYE